MAHKRLGRIHHRHSHCPRSWILRRNSDFWHVTVFVSVPNTSIGYSSLFLRVGLALGHLRHPSLQADIFMDPVYECQIPPPPIPLTDVQVQQYKPWLRPRELSFIRSANATDVGCVAWILRCFTDPQILNAAIRLAGTIQLFYRGIDAGRPYDLVVSMFKECFDSIGKLYPGSRDRAYYSGRVMVWIHTLAMCKPEESARTFPLPNIGYEYADLDNDLKHLMVTSGQSGDFDLCRLLWFDTTGCTSSHLEWNSNVLLHLAWAHRTAPSHDDTLDRIIRRSERTPETKTTIPPNATPNRLLMWCIFLGSRVEGEVLEVQDKSYDTFCFCSPSYSRCSSPVITWNLS